MTTQREPSARSVHEGGEVAVIGSQPQVAGFVLAGARVYPAEDEEQVRSAWVLLPRTVSVVLLTELAAAALGEDRQAPHAPLSAVMPT